MDAPPTYSLDTLPHPTPIRVGVMKLATLDTAMMMSTDSFQPPATSRKKKAPILRDTDWEPHKDRIMELRTLKKTLKQIKETMEVESGFRAEIRQYKSRISQWKLDKNIKHKEMEFIVRKQQRRKLLEPSRPELVFHVRNIKVEPTKIDRWMSRHNMKDTTMVASPTASTPSAVDYRTISERGSPVICSPTPLLDSIASPEQRPYGHFMPTASIIPTYTADVQFKWNIWIDLFCGLDSPGDSSLHLAALSYVQSPELLSVTVDEDLAHCKATSRWLYTDHDNLKQCVHWSHGNMYVLFIPSNIGRDTGLRIGDECLQYWLENGADMEAPVMGGITPLLFACFYFGLETMDYLVLLIKHGANVHAVNDEGLGALHMVLMSLHTCLYSKVPTRSWWRYLDEADTRLVTLLRAGCNPNATDHQGRTPLQCIEFNGVVWNFWKAVLNKSMDRMMLQASQNSHI